VYLEAFKRYKEGQIGELAAARGFWISGDPFHLKQYADPQTTKIRNWFAYRELSGDIIVEQDCHNLDVLHWFLDARPISAVGHGGRKIRKNMDILDNLSLTYVFPNDLNVAFEANQLTPAGFSRVGEEFTGTKGTIEVSRQRMIHHVDQKTHEEMKSAGDITQDSLQAFLTRIQSGQVENVGERSAISTMFALLGRSAIYTGKEVTWKSEFGDV
jgi:myo-inositol 2-dehydrogenase / D-chiro-inositol 1-dehydrogenase